MFIVAGTEINGMRGESIVNQLSRILYFLLCRNLIVSESKLIASLFYFPFVSINSKALLAKFPSRSLWTRWTTMATLDHYDHLLLQRGCPTLMSLTGNSTFLFLSFWIWIRKLWVVSLIWVIGHRICLWLGWSYWLFWIDRFSLSLSLFMIIIAV